MRAAHSFDCEWVSTWNLRANLWSPQLLSLALACSRTHYFSEAIFLAIHSCRTKKGISRYNKLRVCVFSVYFVCMNVCVCMLCVKRGLQAIVSYIMLSTRFSSFKIRCSNSMKPLHALFARQSKLSPMVRWEGWIEATPVSEFVLELIIRQTLNFSLSLSLFFCLAIYIHTAYITWQVLPVSMLCLSHAPYEALGWLAPLEP